MAIWTIAAVATNKTARNNTELNFVEICGLFPIGVRCQEMAEQEVEQIKLPENNCLQNPCENCYTGVKSFVLTETKELFVPTELFYNVTKDKAGKEAYYTCMDRGEVCSCGAQNTCAGTASYCKKQECTPNSNCKCVTEHARGRWDFRDEMGIEHQGIRILTVNTCEMVKPSVINRNLKAYLALPTERAASKEKDDEETQALFIKDSLTIKYKVPIFTVNKAGTLIIRLQGHEYITVLKGDHAQVVIPARFLTSSGPIDFVFFDKGGKTLTGSVHNLGTFICRKSSCIFCTDALYQLKCLPEILIYLLYCLTVVSTGFALVYVRTILIIIFSTGRGLYLICRQMYRLSKGAGRLSLVTGAILGRKLRRGADNVQHFVENNHPQNAVVTAMMLIAIFSGTMASCTSNELLQAEVSKCTEQDQLKNCEMHTQAQITLENIGFTSCLYFSEKQSGNVLTMKIQLQEVTCRFPTNRMYYTFTVTLNVIAESHCSQSEECGWGFNLFKNKHFPGQTRESMSYSGQSVSYASTFNSRCIIVDSQHCVFSRQFLKPDVLQSYEVRRVTSYACSHKLLVTEQSNQTQEEIVVRSTAVTKSGIRLNIIGAYDQPATLFQESYLVARVGNLAEAYLEKVAQVNRPTRGEIGFIQSNESYSKHFLFDPAAIQCKLYEESLFCEMQQSYLEALIKQENRRLPKTVGYHLMQINREGELVSKLLTTAPIVVSVKFQGYKVALRQTNVCPNFADQVLETEGCFSCNMMAKLTFAAFSTCDPGDIAVRAEDLDIVTPIVYLYQTARKIQISFKASSKCTDSRICLANQNYEKCRKISFCLEDPQLGLVQLNVTGERFTTFHAEGQNFLSYLTFGGVQNAMGIIRSLGILAITAIAGIFLFSSVISCIKK